MMTEPDNHTAVIDRFGDTWVRVDEHPGVYPDDVWYPLTDGTAWELRARNGVGSSRTWSEVKEHGPFTEADPQRTADALARVREARSR